MPLVVMMTLEDIKNAWEVQISEEIVSAIADLDVPLVMGCRPKKLNKAIQETAKVSWDSMCRVLVEDEDGFLPSEVVKRLETLFLQVQPTHPCG